MSVPTGNQPDPNQPPSSNGGQGDGHPAWQSILDIIPTELHGLVKPKLAEWDKGVQDRFNQIHQQYQPYKEIVESKVDPGYLEQAVMLAEQFNENPELIIDRAIEHFNLEKYKNTPEPPSESDFIDLNGEFSVDDLQKDPRFKAFFDNQKKLEEEVSSWKETQEEAENSKALDEYIESLHTEHGDFDDDYVLTLMANDVDGNVAVQRYKDKISQAAQALTGPGNQQPPTPNSSEGQPPVVMGGQGNVGAGLPEQPINYGQMTRKQINELVQGHIKSADS